MLQLGFTTYIYIYLGPGTIGVNKICTGEGFDVSEDRYRYSVDMKKIDTYYVYQDHPVNTILSHFCSPLLTMDISHCTDGPNAFDRNLKGFQDYVIIVR